MPKTRNSTNSYLKIFVLSSLLHWAIWQNMKIIKCILYIVCTLKMARSWKFVRKCSDAKLSERRQHASVCQKLKNFFLGCVVCVSSTLHKIYGWWLVVLSVWREVMPLSGGKSRSKEEELLSKFVVKKALPICDHSFRLHGKKMVAVQS